MAVDITQIQLTEADQRMLAEVAERTGKPWAEVLHEALCQFGSLGGSSSPNGTKTESLYDRLSRHGLMGCLEGGPEDLSTKPAYMEGFGESDR